MIRSVSRRILLLAFALVAGCVSRIDSVDKRLILPEGATRYEMAAHQAFVYPVPLYSPMPVFPTEYHPQELVATTICVSFIVDAEGKTTGLTPLLQEGCAPSDSLPLLRDAVLSAMGNWRFEPAMFCTYPDAATRDRYWTGEGCAGEHVKAEVLPVSLAYAFTFEMSNGKHRVSSSRR